MEASLKSRNSSTSPSQRQKQTKDTRLFDLLNTTLSIFDNLWIKGRIVS
jgi:hypothetical protein